MREASVDIYLRCPRFFESKAKYVFDTLFSAMRVGVRYCAGEIRETGNLVIVYSACLPADAPGEGCIRIFCSGSACAFFEGGSDVSAAVLVEGLKLVHSEHPNGVEGWDIPFDLVANAFYFLSSWWERAGGSGLLRRTFSDSVFCSLDIPQDIVDQYLVLLMERLQKARGGRAPGFSALPDWPEGSSFAVVLSHDVDYVPRGAAGQAVAGCRSVLRALIRKRSIGESWKTAAGFLRAAAAGRDAYGCIAAILAGESDLGVKSSFQVAARRHHRCDVNYDVGNEKVRRELCPIIEQDFEVCLHGSFCSTEHAGWYEEEARTLARLLKRPLGSRQHFLAFDYDALFSAQERAGIEYDMSMGFPDRAGPRAGFSYPYYVYNLREDRPYNVVQISLFLMDVTLSGYQRLVPEAAWEVIDEHLRSAQRKRGCFSVVWHPIVFGGARDPGYGDLWWRLIDETRRLGGLATDGRTINAFVRDFTRRYDSFAWL